MAKSINSVTLRKRRDRLVELANQERIYGRNIQAIMIEADGRERVVYGFVDYHETYAGREFYFVKAGGDKIRMLISKVDEVSSGDKFEYEGERYNGKPINLVFNALDAAEERRLESARQAAIQNTKRKTSPFARKGKYLPKPQRVYSTIKSTGVGVLV